MKKRIMGAAAAVMMLASLTACGAKEPSKAISEITKAVVDSGIKFPEMIEVNQKNFEIKYEIGDDVYSDFSVYWTTGADADEVCIIKAKENKAEDVKKAVEGRKQAQMDVFESYAPEQYDKLKNSEVKTEGDYVYWVCTEDDSKAEDTLLSYFK